MRPSSLLRLAMAFAILAALWIPVAGSQAAPAAPTGRVRVVHAVPTAGAVNVLVDSTTVFPNVAFKTVTPYAALAPGSHLFQVVPVGSTSAVISATLPVAADQDWSIAATITPTVPPTIVPVVLLDDNTLPPAGMARVRFVHLVPGAPPVDIAIQGQAMPLFSNVAFGKASPYAIVPTGTYTLEVRLANTSTVLVTAPGVTVANQGVYTGWAMGQVGGTGTAAPSAVLSWDRTPVLPLKSFFPVVFRNP